MNVLAFLSPYIPYLIAGAAAIVSSPEVQAIAGRHPTISVVIGALLAAVLHKTPPKA